MFLQEVPVLLKTKHSKRSKEQSLPVAILRPRAGPNTIISKRSMQHLFEKKRRRRESHNLVERRRRDNINDRIQVSLEYEEVEFKEVHVFLY